MISLNVYMIHIDIKACYDKIKIIKKWKKKDKENAWNPWYCIYIYIYIVEFNRNSKVNIVKSKNKIKKAMCFRGT